MSQFKEPIIFKTREEILSRPDFDIKSSISIGNFDYIIGWFKFNDKERCQVLVKHANCNHEYLEGFVARNHDGKEGMIGCDCANSKFQASKRFSTEQSRIRKAVEWQQLMERAAFYAEQSANMISWLDLDLDYLNDMERLFQEIKNCFPNGLKDRFRYMVKTGRALVTIQLKYIETDEEGDHISWIDSHVGALQEIHLWNADFFSCYRKRLSSSRTALYEIKNAIKTNHIAKLNATLKRLDDFKRAHEEICGIDKSIGNFCSIENMQLMYFMVKNKDFKSNIARAYYIAKKTSPTNDRCKTLCEKIEQYIQQKVDSREFIFAA